MIGRVNQIIITISRSSSQERGVDLEPRQPSPSLNDIFDGIGRQRLPQRDSAFRQLPNDKLAKTREEDNKKISAAEIQYTPLLMFVGAIFLTMLAVYISITSNPLQTAIGNPLNAFKNKFNNTFGIEKGHTVKGLISSEVKSKITSDLKTKAISKFI